MEDKSLAELLENSRFSNQPELFLKAIRQESLKRQAEQHLEDLEQQLASLRHELDSTNQAIAELEQHIVAACAMLGHDLEEGICTECGYIDEREPDFDAEAHNPYGDEF